ncbi:uncharacterized protein GGS22DRAFT_188132 [Annulohypoxylon maeteangense]|uniref:uncharacterized protein n=1 Tax=Annulohypoxylon maeteangense TaxID=1927788 RepID=UPI002007F0AB|nr:uncharacterized protein GGS22DRAFT_188132 [Annulohypoxylon maeteangense]KAI0885844.1 hypothetical protein GGS22DRAFT_188132 [Annulohypoxylon maeteangense]
MADNKPTLHHLENSQSHLTLWLLEELGIEYTLTKHARVNGRSPSALTAVNPVGKSPTLVTPSGRVLTERSAIALWLINAYDEGAKFRLPSPNPAAGGNGNGNVNGGTEDDAVREEQLISFGGATLCPLLTVKLVLALLVKQAPFPIRPLPALVRYAVERVFLDAELAKLFGYLDAQLDVRGKEREWFLGTREPTRTDFSLMWYVDWAVQWKWIDLEKFPRLKAFHARCTARPAWQRALEKGNGYNVAFW